ncbi:MAG: translation initiation factor IF-2 [Bacteroidales bacterium]
MAEKMIRLNKVAREFNLGVHTIVEFLKNKGTTVEASPNSKITEEMYAMLAKEFGNEQTIKDKEVAKSVLQKKQIANNLAEEESNERELIIKSADAPIFTTEKPKIEAPKVVNKIDLDAVKPKRAKEVEVNKKEAVAVAASAPKELPKKVERKEIEIIAQPIAKIGVKVVDKITLDTPKEEKKKIIAVKKAQEKEQKVIDEEKNIKSAEPTTIEIPKAQPKEEKSPPEKPFRQEDAEFVSIQVDKLSGPVIKDKIDLSQFKPGDLDSRPGKREKRARIKTGAVNIDKEAKNVVGKPQDQRNNRKDAPKKTKFGKQQPAAKPVNPDEIDRQIKETLNRMLEKGNKHKGAAKRRQEKREDIRQRIQEESALQEQERQILKLSEFVTANDLSRMMNLTVNEVIAACMDLGLMASINQRLDAEAISLIAENFGHKVEFVTVETQGIDNEEEDNPEDLIPRSPIVTVMGHVDHGKTSLLDSIRKANVIAGEAGGITQHIGAYHVQLEDGRTITFLDTPGHEAFTAMRARGAKITDLAIIIIAADDSVMPQTTEAINHAVAAGVPMIFAINKIDKDGANPDKIREQLATMNYLVEDWGGKYQVQEVAAKKGINIDKLLEKVLLETDLLELTANPKRRAQGTIIESFLDKGRGYISRLMVQNGTLRIGDVVISGHYTGRVKAMYNERGQKVEEAGPSIPVEILGLNGAPTAGETFNMMLDEREARDIATKREQLKREQGMRTQKHITLDEIGRRLAIGSFKELNIIVKGDVDGSVEALTDALLKLSTEQVQLNVIHKAVGAISESDVHLAVASEAIIVGFQVRPSASTRKLAEQEQIEIRTYSIIYDAINEIKAAIAGMHAPEFKEEVVCSVEIMQVYRVTKVGMVAGCIVREGKINRNTKIRVIRDGIVVHQGELASLKRFKDDVKEVASGFECGLNLANYNDIKEGDIIEGYDSVIVKK